MISWAGCHFKGITSNSQRISLPWICQAPLDTGKPFTSFSRVPQVSHQWGEETSFQPRSYWIHLTPPNSCGRKQWTTDLYPPPPCASKLVDICHCLNCFYWKQKCPSLLSYFWHLNFSIHLIILVAPVWTSGNGLLENPHECTIATLQTLMCPHLAYLHWNLWNERANGSRKTVGRGI